MAGFKILETPSINEENVDETYVNPCFSSTLDISSDSDKVSPEQLTVSTIIGLSDDTKDSKISDEVIVKVESLTNHKPGYTTQTVSSVSSDTTIKKEKSCSVSFQIFIPFMIAGMGTIGAGIVLGNVEEYEVFKNIQALFILVPSMLGLKGNLDMCLASRMSTHANMGRTSSKREIFLLIVGNIGLVQVQAIAAACVVSIFANVVSLFVNGVFDVDHAFILAASSVLTATISCFILDFLLIAVIFLTKKLRMNPDNLATPLAASIGDIVSLLLLSFFSSIIYAAHDTYYWCSYVILSIYLFVFLPIWILIVRKNKYTRAILTDGWTPVLSALFISGLGGLVLDKAVDSFTGYVVFQPIINGIGGNLVSVQSSRISTMLHQTSIPGVFPPHTKLLASPWKALFKGVYSAKTARILILMSVPGQTAFVYLADLFYNDGVSTITPVFVVTYLMVGLIQIMLLLYTAHFVTHIMWKLKRDPDNSSIPYLTALGDLLGSTLLLLGFMLLKSTPYEYTPIV